MCVYVEVGTRDYFNSREVLCMTNGLNDQNKKKEDTLTFEELRSMDIISKDS